MMRFLLTRITVQILFGIFLLFLVDCRFVASRETTAEEIPEKTIDALLADLGNPQFETREAATSTLKERVEAIPALRKAAASEDREVRRRVQEILTALERKCAASGVSKAKALGQAGRAVEVADRLAFAAKCGVAGDEGWESLTRLAERMITHSEQCFPPGCSLQGQLIFPAGDFRRFAQKVKSKEIAVRKFELDTGKEMDTPFDPKKTANRKFLQKSYGLLLRAEEISITGRSPLFGLQCGMIAASKDVHLLGGLSSVVVAGGDIKELSCISHCIFICDGDIELLEIPQSNCLIVARGKVTCKREKLHNCFARSGHTLYFPDGKKIDLKDGVPDPLSFVKFFELADVGLNGEDLPARGKSASEGTRLKEVRKDSPFASGLRSGDVITALEDQKTPTTEIFRRVLRRKLAEGEPLLTFTVRRDGKTLEVPIAMKTDAPQK